MFKKKLKQLWIRFLLMVAYCLILVEITLTGMAVISGYDKLPGKLKDNLMPLTLVIALPWILIYLMLPEESNWVPKLKVGNGRD